MSAPTAAGRGRPSPFDTNSLVFWLVIVLVLYGLYSYASQIAIGLGEEPTATVLCLVLWAVYAALAVWLIYRLQLFQRRPLISIAAALCWGAFVAVGAAFSANAGLQELVVRIGGPLTAINWGPAIAAPINEETLKVLGVIALALLPLGGVRSTLDGLFYGMMVGLGFQVAEDVTYGLNAVFASGDTGSLLSSFVTRGLVAGLFSHAVYAGITGAGIGYAASRTDQPWSRRIGVAVLLFLVAVFFHSLWDSPLLGEVKGEPFTAVLFLVIKGLPVLILLLVLVRWARREDRARFARVSETRVDAALLPESERAALMSTRTRKRARKAARKEHGRKAKKPTRQLQHAQLDLVQAIDEGGPDSPQAAEATGRVQAARERLSAVGAPAPA